MTNEYGDAQSSAKYTVGVADTQLGGEELAHKDTELSKYFRWSADWAVDKSGSARTWTGARGHRLVGGLYQVECHEVQS